MTRRNIIQTLKYLINLLTAGVIGWLAYLNFALRVLPPIGQTREESINLLKTGIIDIGLEHALTGFIAISFLIVLTWLIQNRIEKERKLKELIAIAIMNFTIVGFGITLGMFHTFKALIIEIDRHF